MQRFCATVAALYAVVMLPGCGVDTTVVGSYANPDAGIIILGDDGNGSYINFQGDIRAVPGDYQEPAPGVFLAGSHDDRPWDDTYIDWRSTGDTVTLLPAGGPALQATHREGALVLTHESGSEARVLVFVLNAATE